MVENLPANAGDTGSSPGLGRSHMPRSNWARESQLLSLRVWSLCFATREAAIVRGPRTAMKSGPRLPQLEKALAQKRRPNTAINKLINYFFFKKAARVTLRILKKKKLVNFCVAIFILQMEEKSNVFSILCFIISRKVQTQLKHKKRFMQCMEKVL